MPNDIQKNQIDIYLKALANEFKRITSRKVKAEIIIVGGGALMINYDFRMNSVDIDAFNTSEEAVKTAALKVAERFDLPADWLNDDFKKTKSYSPQLRTYSKHYKTFSNVLEFRTINREYLIAMKMVSGRKYKRDFSDILGILNAHYQNGDEITFKDIDKAVKNLYGSWDRITDEIKERTKAAIESKSFIKEYEKQVQNEQKIKAELISFDERYPDALTEDNLDEIINLLE